MIDATRWARVKDLFYAALDRAPAERVAFVRAGCASDAALAVDVESLLTAHEQARLLGYLEAVGSRGPSLVASGVTDPGRGRLQPGESFGAYEIRSFLAAGAMGDVYRARDMTLSRDVALKVLPEAFASDRDRLSRFKREAQVLASLNHPNIAHVYGLEESVPSTGSGQSTVAMVMELVEGQTLAERLALGPLPVAQALTVARQIVAALDATHEKGIVHRDLKPANIKITATGVVKVLDFGLAKFVGGATPSPAPLPTATAGPTLEGMIVGTGAYMSPEQARGQPVDKRTDIWAFGCVLYEMLTARNAFAGATFPDTLAAILDRDPDWALLPAGLEPQLHRLLRRCLEKDPARRLRDIGDAVVELDDMRKGATSYALVTKPPTRGLSFAAITSLGALIVAGLASAVWINQGALSRVPPPEVRLEITAPVTRDFMSFAISPDALQVVFTGDASPNPGLWVRELNAGMPRFLLGTEGATLPFWSPDSRSIGFFADNRIKRIDLKGGSVQVLAEAFNPQGGSWGADGTILFAPTQIAPIMRVSATGSGATPVTRIDPPQLGHLFPHLLPDGTHFLYTVVGPVQVRGLYIGELGDSVPRRLLADPSAAVLSASGHLLFARENALLAQALDPGRLELVGEPIRVADSVATDRSTVGGPPGAAVSASAAGTIVYRRASTVEQQLVWYDRSGKELTRLGAPSAARQGPALSPDGKTIAVTRLIEGNRDIWLLDIRRNVYSRFTFDPANDNDPIWTSDGSRIVFSSSRSGVLGLYQKSIAGGGEEPLLVTEQNSNTCDVSPDGGVLLFSRADSKTLRDLWMLPLGSGEAARLLVQTSAQDLNAEFAPDGTWLAFQSNESGRHEVSVRPFLGGGPAIQVSINGGTQPRWRSDGRELFYIDLERRLMAVPVAFSRDGHSVEVGIPSALFPTRIGGANTGQGEYVAAPDGQRFLLDTPIRDVAPPINVILNWRPSLWNESPRTLR